MCWKWFGWLFTAGWALLTVKDIATGRSAWVIAVDLIFLVVMIAFDISEHRERKAKGGHGETEVLVSLNKPNHFYDDALGNPETCTGDHNHPSRGQA